MKVSTPKSRQDLHIKRRDRVLEVGPGNRPSFRANVLVEKFLGDDTHRCGGLRIFPHQQLVNAAAEALPFADKEFDYVICNQVLEHSDDPAQFLREVMRVGKAGYIETPSLLGEWLFPKKSHRWVVLNIGDKLFLYDKRRVPGNYANDYGELVPELPALPVAPLQTAALLRRGVAARTLRVERRYRFPDKPHGRILQQVLPEEMGSRNGLHTLSSPRTRDGTGAHAPRRSPRHRRQTAPVTGTPSPLAGRIQSPPSRRIQITRECKNPSAQVIPGHITILTTKNIRQFRMFFVYLSSEVTKRV